MMVSESTKSPKYAATTKHIANFELDSTTIKARQPVRIALTSAVLSQAELAEKYFVK
jgi:hypothetical protein